MPHSANNSTSTPTKMSRPSSTSTYSGTAFPKQAGAALLCPDNTGAGQPSPSQSQFSFTSSPFSMLEIEDSSRQYPQGTAENVYGSLRPMTSSARAKFYEDQFSYRGTMVSSARERISKDAPIVAELRTNVIIKDEYTLVTDLSHHLSTRYQRPEASIMITVNHSACLLLGGSFEPTYILTINALPIQVQPITNKRNAALIQTFMAESIGVPADRGIVKFIPIAEENLATNGMTVLGEIERLERQQVDENGTTTVKRGRTKNSRKSSVFKAKSTMQLSHGSSKTDLALNPAITSEVPLDGPLDSAVAINETGMDEEPAKSKMSSKKSEPMLSMFSKSSSANLAQRPITADRPVTPGINKRHSFLKVFRR